MSVRCVFSDTLFEIDLLQFGNTDAEKKVVRSSMEPLLRFLSDTTPFLSVYETAIGTT